MSRVVASLAAVFIALGLVACDDDGAEPGASREATLVLDFQPNAVHAGIYAALEQGFYADRGVDLEVRAPGASTDAPKLLQAGRAEFAILDINDLGIARERGGEIVAIEPIVARPLAAVIAADRGEVDRPRDLEGGTVGVTGLPSDDAVLDSVLEADGADPDQVRRVTVGFDSVAALSAGRIDAATAFWNAEGVMLRALNVPSREFRVDDYGAPRYPELVLVTSEELLRDEPGLAAAVAHATRAGYELVVSRPEDGIAALEQRVEGLDAASQRGQLDALLNADAFRASPFGPAVARWVRWAADHGVVEPGAHLRGLVD